jgi:hypothetical protein
VEFYYIAYLNAFKQSVTALEGWTSQPSSPTARFGLSLSSRFISTKQDDLGHDTMVDKIQSQGSLIKMFKEQKAYEEAFPSSEQEDSFESSGNVLLKAPRGTRDFAPHQMIIRERVLDKVVRVLKRHGGEALDTPVFERKVTHTHVPNARYVL